MIKVKCEVWSRVTGYYRPVDQFNPGKKQEFWDRTNFLNWSKTNSDTIVNPVRP
jgi:hypothetical protein